MSFVGDYTVKADVKGRVAIPSAFRKLLENEVGERFVFQKDVFQNCMNLYPIKIWENKVAELKRKLNNYNRNHKRFRAQFFRDTAEVEMDKSGRLLFPKRIAEVMGLEKELVLAGVDEYIEVWNKTIYNENAMSDEEFAQLAEDIMGKDNLNNTDQ